MLDGLSEFVALLLAFCICVMHPGIPAALLLLLVAAAILAEAISRPAEDGERTRERDRW